MKEVLDPLVRIAGVKQAVLVAEDGVPIAVLEMNAGASEPSTSGSDPAQIHALSGLAIGWIGEIRRAVDPLSWDPPQYMVLRAARGTLLAMRAPGCLLLVILERGAQPEDLRVPMGAAVARIQRVLRRTPAAEPVGALPGGRKAGSERAPVGSELTQNEVPEVSGER